MRDNYEILKINFQPRPHIPSGIDFNCTGEGLMNPTSFSPSNIFSERRSDENDQLSSVRTSCVRFLAAIFLLGICLVFKVRSISKKSK